MKQRLAIFDFDGTLFDTVPANYAAYRQALEPYGVSLSENCFASACNGRYYRDFLPPLLPDASREQIDAIHRAKIECYPSFYDRIVENTALFDLLAALSETYFIALVSTATKQSVLDILTKFRRVSAFDLILTQQDVPKKKPAPDGFLMAMRHFHVAPEQTIIFEDSPEGEQAAQACGAACLMVHEIVSGGKTA